MEKPALVKFYEQYINCLNIRNWDDLHLFVHGRLLYNKQPIQLSDYRAMLEQNYRDIPDLRFQIALLTTGDNLIGCRLDFDCTPVGKFLGIAVNGKPVVFSEHVFYQLQEGKIAEVWSLIDKDAIRDQINS